MVRNGYSAELGGAAGGVVNIVSKSGGNNFHGGAFGLFRDKAFDARNAFDFNPNGQSPFSRQQYGGSFGGPLRQDKTFFFSPSSGSVRSAPLSSTCSGDPNMFQPTASQNALLNFLSGVSTFAWLAAGLRGALTRRRAQPSSSPTPQGGSRLTNRRRSSRRGSTTTSAIGVAATCASM